MSINQKIQNIVELRAKHLPKIDEELCNLDKIEKALNELDALRTEVKTELDNGQGVYFSMLTENPKMQQAYNKVDTWRVRDLLVSQRSKLENLKKRFSRKTVCIAMIGYERQGKSTFLQAISGLNNKVIPAYSGTSCTGAVSVIHNIEGAFHVDVTYYTVNEFLEIIKQKLNKFFPQRHFSINTPHDLLNVDLSGFSTADNDLNGEFVKFQEAYKGHVNDYWNLLGQGTVSYTDENDVIRHVAQYEEFDSPVSGSFEKIDNDGKVVYVKNYYKYLAVKNVHIYKTFEMIDSKLIELVDTIGMGTFSENEKIKEEMFRVLREDCDAAVDLFKPGYAGGFSNEQSSILQEIANRLEDRDPSKWIVYVINKVKAGSGRNEGNIPAILNQVGEFLKYMTVRPIAWVDVVDGSNPAEVRSKLVEPLLKLITDNLPALDALVMEDANATGESLKAAYYQLVNNVEAVISGSLMRGTSEGKMFDDLYETLGLSSALRKLEEDNYGKRKDKPCVEIERAISAVVENLYSSVIPDKSKIEKAIDDGAKSPDQIYADCCDEMRTRIVREFDSVSDCVISPLRETAKEAVAKVLFEAGRMGNIPLKGYAIKDGPSLEWLNCLVEEKVKESDFPRLRKILRYVLKYDFTIKYNIEYDVTSNLGIIDKMNHAEYKPFMQIPFGTVEERTNGILRQLVNKVPYLQQKLRVGKDKFALIPSHSFWAMINNFRTDVVRGDDTKRDLKEFYRENAWSVWKDEFSSIVDKQQAFGKWNDLAQTLSELYSSSRFTIQ